MGEAETHAKDITLWRNKLNKNSQDCIFKQREAPDDDNWRETIFM